MLIATVLGEAVEGSFGNPWTTLTANDSTLLRTSPGTIGVSRNPSRTWIQENGAGRLPNSSVPDKRSAAAAARNFF
jgi:hypothetical protein